VLTCQSEHYIVDAVLKPQGNSKSVFPHIVLSPSRQQTHCWFSMPCPARSPQRQYVESTTWWECPICSKPCKSKSGQTRHIRQLHGNAILNDSDPGTLQPDQENSSPLRCDDIQGENRDTLEPMDFDFAVPLSDADPPRLLTPHARFDFDDTPIDHHSTSPSSPLSNDVPESNNHSNQGSQSPQPDIGSTTYHPVMNGRLWQVLLGYNVIIF
jgi:hypothetical protein